MTPYRFDPSILREYDIRGIVGKTLNLSDASALGHSFGTLVRQKGGRTVAVGYDGRLSSPEMAAKVIEGLRATGIDVISVGLGPTPMLYYTVKELHTDAGVMITGSHNPSDYNGFKMLHSSGPVYGELILEIGRIAEEGNHHSGSGALTEIDLRDLYVERLLKDYTGTEPLHVAWDPGSGATGEVLRRLLKRLPGMHEVIHDEIDGTFPHHHPDPTVPENLKDLQALVAAKGCDLGIAFDGDGDRIGAVDAGGRIVWGDQLLAIYAAEVLEAMPGATIIGEVKSSQVLYDEIARLGGKPLMWKTGHSLIKAKMAETGSPLAGEMSGHIFFGDKWYGFDDAMYCAVRLISLLSRQGVSLGELLDRMPKVCNTPETRFEVDETRKFAVIAEVKSRLAAVPGLDVNDIDGVRVTTTDGWWLLRASNTQNVLVARAEASNPERLNELKSQIGEQLSQSGIAVPEGF
jgi:phosphomannomutase